MLIFFQNHLFRNILSEITSECQKSFDPDQARHADLGTNCAKRLSADNTSKH